MGLWTIISISSHQSLQCSHLNLNANGYYGEESAAATLDGFYTQTYCSCSSLFEEWVYHKRAR